LDNLTVIAEFEIVDALKYLQYLFKIFILHVFEPIKLLLAPVTFKSEDRGFQEFLLVALVLRANCV